MMEKSDFLKTAHYYYAPGIINHFLSDVSPTTETAIEESYSPHFWRTRVLDRAIRFLCDHEMLLEVQDPFGPRILEITDNFAEKWNQLQMDPQYPFYNYSRAGRGGNAWIRRALQKLDEEYLRLEVSDADFDVPPDKEWEPLPIDRDDPHLNAAIEKIDDTVEQVRIDNGYAITLPEERTYVLDNLLTLSKRLKEAASISVPYLQRYGLEPLSRLIRRFGKAAVGLVAQAAKEAIKEWLKRKGIHLLDDL